MILMKHDAIVPAKLVGEENLAISAICSTTYHQTIAGHVEQENGLTETQC